MIVQTNLFPPVMRRIVQRGAVRDVVRYYDEGWVLREGVGPYWGAAQMDVECVRAAEEED